MAVQLEFEKKPKIWLSINDSMLMIKRSSTHILRNTDQLLGTFFQPIMFLLLFAAVFGGAIGMALPEGVKYLDYLLAGIIVQTVVFRNGISTLIMIIVGLVIGFRSNATVMEWLLIAFILFLFTLAFSWLSAIVGLLAKSVEGVQWISFVLVLPLTFASSAFVPTSGMPTALRVFAENQPITQIIEAVRGLMLGFPASDYVVKSIIWSLVILAVAVPIAAYLFKRKTTH